MNKPTFIPVTIYVRCTDAEKPAFPVKDWPKEGEIYGVYALAKILKNEYGKDNDNAFFLMDKKGNRMRPHPEVPTYRADRFNFLNRVGEVLDEEQSHPNNQFVVFLN